MSAELSEGVRAAAELARLPLLKYIFGDNDKTERDDQIVFLLIPHVVRAEMLDPLNLLEEEPDLADAPDLTGFVWPDPMEGRPSF